MIGSFFFYICCNLPVAQNILPIKQIFYSEICFPIDAFKSYGEIEGSTLFLLPMLKKNIEVFVSFLFMVFVFNFRMIFIFCPILTFRSSLFIVNSILTFYRYCFYFIYTDIAYMIYYIFLMVLTNSLSDIPSKLGPCFYVFQTMFLTINFLHPTENLTYTLPFSTS